MQYSEVSRNLEDVNSQPLGHAWYSSFETYIETPNFAMNV